MAERRARRRKPSKDVGTLKQEIADREAAAAVRRAERGPTGASARPDLQFKKKKLTPAEQHEQEKKERAKRGSSGYGYSQHLMGGSSSSSRFNPHSVREEVLSYLLDEGFASDEKSAEAIMGAMSEAWIESIVEAVGIVGPPSKAIDKIPGVRAVRNWASDTVKASDYGTGQSVPQTVSGRVIPRGIDPRNAVDLDPNKQTKNAPTAKLKPTKPFIPGDDRMPGQPARSTVLPQYR
jgi:hypothetical protein